MSFKKKCAYAFAIFVFVTFVYLYFPEQKLDNNATIDYILVKKSERKMEVYQDGRLLKTYKISLGRVPIGAKQYEGDKKTPEGRYTINDRNSTSGYHKNLGISYPNDKEAKKIGRLPGGDIKIHGIRNYCGIIGKFHRWTDWTLGCIALTNREIDEIYAATPLGTTIEIRP